MNEYEKYRLQWMLDHDYSLPDLLERLSDIAMNENLDEIQNPRVMLNEAFERLEYEQGFDNEEIWLCKDEWENDLEVLKDFEMKVNNLERKYCEIFNNFIVTSNSSSINMYGMYELMNEALYLYRNTINYCFGQLSSKEKEESDNAYIHSGESP